MTRALHAGVAEAQRMRAEGLIGAAVLCLGDRVAQRVLDPRASVRRRGVMATDIRK